jgi:hypothetical protein
MLKPFGLAFVGTGNFHTTAGYWSRILIIQCIPVENSPSVLRNRHLPGRCLNDTNTIIVRRRAWCIPGECVVIQGGARSKADCASGARRLLTGGHQGHRET